MEFFVRILYFCVGGGLYVTVELLWRGRSHVSMFCLGGGCFLILGQLARMPLPLPLLAVAGSVIVTALELVTGLLVNRDHHIWDYRGQKHHFRGQICLRYSLLWVPLCYLAMALYGGLEHLIKLKNFS